jgi:prepilin-type N-terminal cleavage/methylation domain-containing protein
MLNDANGFTLIEIMTALSILAISLVILLGLRNKDMVLSARADHIIEATLLARKKISEVSMDLRSDTGERKGEFGEEHPNYLWEMTLNETPFPQVQELILSVLWKESAVAAAPCSGCRIQMTTYLFSDKK